jgi:hypothetical protein
VQSDISQLESLSGPARMELDLLIRETQRRDQCTPEQALLSVVRTKRGAALWEQGRAMQLSESATLERFTQADRD